MSEFAARIEHVRTVLGPGGSLFPDEQFGPIRDGYVEKISGYGAGWALENSQSLLDHADIQLVLAVLLDDLTVGAIAEGLYRLAVVAYDVSVAAR